MVSRIDPSDKSIIFHLTWKPQTIESHVGQGQQHWDQVAEGEAGPGGGGQGGHWEDEAGADNVDQVKHREENQQSARKICNTQK